METKNKGIPTYLIAFWSVSNIKKMIYYLSFLLMEPFHKDFCIVRSGHAKALSFKDGLNIIKDNKTLTFYIESWYTVSNSIV